MSVERMRILLSLDDVNSAVDRGQRQQITPDINFTCDGMITKWILGAHWKGDEDLYPELQIWRRIGNESDTYQKINGTFIEIENENENGIYEYDNFAPIPVLTGDILGVFLPRPTNCKLKVRSEDKSSPINYYLDVESFTSLSPVHIINLQSTESLKLQGYHSLVSVEVGQSNCVQLYYCCKFKYSSLKVLLYHCVLYSY